MQYRVKANTYLEAGQLGWHLENTDGEGHVDAALRVVRSEPKGTSARVGQPVASLQNTGGGVRQLYLGLTQGVD